MSTSVAPDRPAAPPSDTLATRGRLAFMLVLAVYGVLCLRHPERGGLLDAVDLAIHETGHLVFAAFGEVIHAAGGTLFQLIVPAVFVGYFLRRGERYAASVPLWWVAQNCWHISVYVKDARAMELPLVGGGEHDWNFLLGEFGVLAHDQGIGQTIHACGLMIYLAAIALGVATAATPRTVARVEEAEAGFTTAG